MATIEILEMQEYLKERMEQGEMLKRLYDDMSKAWEKGMKALADRITEEIKKENGIK